MKVVWALGPATVRDVYEALRRHRKVAYTTVMTMMNILEQKGHLKKKRGEKAYVYQAAKPRKQVVRNMVEDFLGRVFDGLGMPMDGGPQPLTNRAVIWRAKGDFDRATNALKAAVFWNPKLGPAHVLLGRIAVLKNDCATAQGSADKALQIDANDQDALALKRLIEQKCKTGPG